MKVIRTNLLTPTADNMQSRMDHFSRVLSGQVSFGSTAGNKDVDRNIECSKSSGTSGAANTDFAVAHTLGRIPVTFFGHTDNGGTLYKGVGTWTKTQIFLRSTTANANYVVVVI